MKGNIEIKKLKNKILFLSILGGAVFWLVDALLDYFFFFEGTFLELLIFHVSPHEIHVRLTGIILFLIFGQVIIKILINLQETEKKRQQTLEKAQNYLNIAAVMLVVIDADQRVTLINKKGCEILGYREDEIIGQNWFDNFLPEKIKTEIKGIFNILIAGKIEPTEYAENPILTKTEQERIIAWHNTVLRDEQGKITSILSSGEDITQQKHAERKLKESEEELRTILNASPDMIMKVDTNLRIFWANKACLDMNPDAIGEPCYKAYIDKEEPCENCPCKRAMKTGQIERGIKYQPTIKGIRGESFWEDIGVPLKDNQGKVIGLVEIARNVTEHQQAEKALQRAQDELESKVAKRTRELSEANLRLRELDLLKSMFIAGMSHELRTPLNSIIGFTGVLLLGMDGKITNKQQDHLEIIKKNSHHLLTLINNIIDISKIEAGKVIPILEELNLLAMVQEIKDSFSVTAAKKDIMIYLKMSEKLNIRSDEQRLKQALINIVNNALKFTDKGKIEIKAIKKKELVEISVKDTGIGIAKKDMDKLFKAFSQISVKGQINSEGAGLGLYLTKKIINLLGGTIGVESEQGKGSEFIITLPSLTFDGDTSYK